MNELDTRLGNIETLLRSVVKHGSAENVDADGGTQVVGESNTIGRENEGNNNAKGVGGAVKGEGQSEKRKARRSALWRLRPCGA